MQRLFGGLAAAMVVSLCVLGLTENASRAGPFDLELVPMQVQASVAGTYQARPAVEPVLGVCVEPPCEAHTSLDLVFRGLPAGDYEARLDGTRPQKLGLLANEGSVHVLRWTEAKDHTDKQELVLAFAGRDVGAVPLGTARTSVRIDGPLTLTWGSPAGSVHLAEIGGVTVSTIANLEVHEVPPPGWSFHARLEGVAGNRELGPLVGGDGALNLEGRVERMKLEEQQRIIIVLRPENTQADGFPVLQATFGGSDRA